MAKNDKQSKQSNGTRPKPTFQSSFLASLHSKSPKRKPLAFPNMPAASQQGFNFNETSTPIKFVFGTAEPVFGTNGQKTGNVASPADTSDDYDSAEEEMGENMTALASLDIKK